MYHPHPTANPFASYKDYDEGKMRDKGRVFIGTRDDLKKYSLSVDTEGTASRFYGCILRPEARKDEWTYMANKAFFAGVMEAGREVILESDIEHDPHNRLFSGYTCDELLWLPTHC